MSNIPPELNDLIELLAQTKPCPEEIWLIGSRANGRAIETSDWDLLIFASPEFVKEAKPDLLAGEIDTDVLVVTDGDSFEAIGKIKSGNLTNWDWEKTAPDAATYEGTKFIADEESSAEFGGNMGNFVSRKERAIRIWAAN